ncbi:TrmJ/YjtD family RNA methyltransferase [bacterium]|nr:TrmJ/YjtD family RNA methyltransferase [bacterium]
MASREPASALTASDPLRAARIVLVRPRGAANVGAAARAMKNLGLAELVLVRPAIPRLAAAERMAVHARDLVRGARLADTLPAAVADCHLVVGTTCRRGGYRAEVDDLGALAPAMVARAATGPLAIVFGPEDHGLSNADLRHCHRVCAIDTSAAYPSLNLAQAVLLVCWELRRAAQAGAPAVGGAPVAPAAEVAALLAHLRAALLRIGYLNPQNPDHVMHALRGILGRATLTPHDVRLLRGMARQMEWAGSRAAGTPSAGAAPSRRRARA